MSAGACVWSGIILDPGFQNVPAGAWTLQKGAVIQAAAGGNIEAGQLFVDKATLCTSRGRASQSVVIPALADVGPLSLRVASNGDCTNSSGSCTGSGTSIIVNGGVNIAPYHALSTIDQICLGDRAYGGSMSVVVRPSSRAVCVAATTLDAVVDHVSIETGANCPTPGTLPDGGFESTPSNWTPSVTTANSPPPVAEIKAGIGTAGSMAAHLNTNDRCQQAMITGPTSPPTALPNAAIQFSYKGTAGERMIIQQGGVPIASTLANGTQQVGKACLLESNKGVTQSTTFGILLNGSSGCGAYVKDFVIDDLAFVSDTTCPTTSLVPDPGFERADPAGMWSPLVSNNGVAAGVAFAGVSAVASEARSGSHSFSLRAPPAFGRSAGCGAP